MGNYVGVNWIDGKEGKNTPVNAHNLNIMNSGIRNCQEETNRNTEALGNLKLKAVTQLPEVGEEDTVYLQYEEEAEQGD